MKKPKTKDREQILEYFEHRTPALNSRRPITEKEKSAVLSTFDAFNDYQTVATIAEKARLSPERTKTICFKLSLLDQLYFDNRDTNPNEFKYAKHGRSTWIFKRKYKYSDAVRLVPNSPLFNLPDSSRERLDKTLDRLKEDLRRYGVEADTLKIGDTIQVHIKGTPGGLLVAAKHLTNRRF